MSSPCQARKCSGGSDGAEFELALAVALALGLDLALGAERGDAARVVLSSSRLMVRSRYWR